MIAKYQKVVCCWVGDKEGCRQPTIYGKSYCESHYERVYTSLLPEMADYIINKELNEIGALAKHKTQ